MSDLWLSSKTLWLRSAAIYRKVWALSNEEQEPLNEHFLLRSTTTSFLDKVYQDTHDCFKDKIQIGVVIFEVEYMNCSATYMEKSKPADLLLSCRVRSAKNFAVVIVQPKYEQMSDSRYFAIREL